MREANRKMCTEKNCLGATLKKNRLRVEGKTTRGR